MALMPWGQNSAALARDLFHWNHRCLCSPGRVGNLVAASYTDTRARAKGTASGQAGQKQTATSSDKSRSSAPGLLPSTWLTVREDSVDLLSSDLALRCGDSGEAEVSGRGVVGASMGRSCGREQPPVSESIARTVQGSGSQSYRRLRATGPRPQATGMPHLCWSGNSVLHPASRGHRRTSPEPCGYEHSSRAPQEPREILERKMKTGHSRATRSRRMGSGVDLED